ncbi:hypothetical protein AN958_02760 [Leucoagaricus sp. SymC.cos]|nr:hypothetical protein AN958_02760 [Leucoagaricus sp. SymC.cos]
MKRNSGNDTGTFDSNGSSGFGVEVTKQVLQSRGDTSSLSRKFPPIYALFPPILSPSFPGLQLSSPLWCSNFLLPYGVASPAQISAAFTTTLSCFDRIDVVFNGARCAILGEVENTPEDQARKMFDVSFWGMCDVSREAVKVFRGVNGTESAGGKTGGKLLNVSSTSGVVPNTGVGCYCARYVWMLELSRRNVTLIEWISLNG